MIDIHSHILPNVDDGSKDIEITKSMLKTAYRSGTTKIVATPHYNKHYNFATYSKTIDMVEKLRKIIKPYNIGIEIYYGQEVYYYEDIIEKYKQNLIGTINNTRYMLVELPIEKYESNSLNVLYELMLQGVKVILAHPERYRAFIKNPTLINEFTREGFLFQMNSASIEGYFGKDVKKTCETFLNSGVYSFLGSDAHSNVSRITDMSECIDIVKQKHPQTIIDFENNGNLMLNDEDVYFKGEEVSAKKSIFSIFKR